MKKEDTDEQRANSLGKQKEVGGGNHAVSRPISPSTPPLYMERFHSDSFLTNRVCLLRFLVSRTFSCDQSGHINYSISFFLPSTSQCPCTA